jgi:hypothetical protein
MKVPLLIVSLSMLISSSVAQPDFAWVRIKTEHEMREKIDTIHFEISDGYKSRTVYSTADSTGVFLTGFDISNSIDILWGYRKDIALPLIISPNDTLQITIISEKDGVLFGKRARTCANLMDMCQAQDRPRAQVYESEYSSDPREFVEIMNEKLNSNLRFANSFCKSTKCTKTFVTWYIKSAYVSYYRNLADYCHAFQRRANEDAVQLNTFLRVRNIVLKRIDLNDETLEMSSGYYDLLKSIFSLYVSPRELRSLYQESLRKVKSGSVSKREINTAVWKTIDLSVKEKLSAIEDDDIRKVIFTYYKGMRNWI